MGKAVPYYLYICFVSKLWYHITKWFCWGISVVWPRLSLAGTIFLPLQTWVTEANIVRVKCYRNTVCGHASQASVDDATFNTCWQDISNALVALGGASYAAAINKLKNKCMDPDTEEHYRELLKQWKDMKTSSKKNLKRWKVCSKDWQEGKRLEKKKPQRSRYVTLVVGAIIIVSRNPERWGTRPPICLVIKLYLPAYWYLALLFLYAAAAYHASLVEPRFASWWDTVKPKYPQRHQKEPSMPPREVYENWVAIKYLPQPNWAKNPVI